LLNQTELASISNDLSQFTKFIKSRHNEEEEEKEEEEKEEEEKGEKEKKMVQDKLKEKEGVGKISSQFSVKFFGGDLRFAEFRVVYSTTIYNNLTNFPSSPPPPPPPPPNDFIHHASWNARIEMGVLIPIRGVQTPVFQQVS
jgi:hypothetical protein